MKTIVIGNGNIAAAFDPGTGALTGLKSRLTGWELISKPSLGLSFILQVPVPGKRANFVHGAEQKLASASTDPNGKRAIFTWKNLKSAGCASLKIELTAEVSVDEDGIRFVMTVNNKSKHTVEVVAYPCIGGMRPPARDVPLYRTKLSVLSMWRQMVHPNFNNRTGYWGAHNPSDHENKSTETPFMLVEDATQGFYLGRHAVEHRNLAVYFFRQKPGYVDSHISMVSGDDVLAGHEVSLELLVQQFAYAAPGTTYTTDPIVVTAYKGNWQAGADLYKKWRRTWFKRPPTPAWAQDVHSWLQIQIYSAEDNVNFRYKELPAIARECRKHGISAIQLTGWAHGGQDRGNPFHDTDDALGTRAEFKKAIADCRKMGVKIIPFTKWTWVDQSQPWYRKEGSRHTAKNPWGFEYPAGGYNYFTWTQIAGIGTHPLVPTCTASPEWRKRALVEFRKVLDLGADGMLFDELVHHGSAQYCFDRKHKHPKPAFIYAYDRLLAQDFRKAAEKTSPDFLFSGEFWREEQMLEYSLCYTRFGAGHTPMHRYIDPQLPIMMAVTGFDDRNQINKCLEYRYIISYEPFNFKGRPGDALPTVEYGGKVDALRRKYRKYLWDGEYRSSQQATVKINGKHSNDFSCYRAADFSGHAVVITNLDKENKITAEVEFDKARPMAVATPEQPEARPVSGTIDIPPRSVSVVMSMANEDRS